MSHRARPAKSDIQGGGAYRRIGLALPETGESSYIRRYRRLARGEKQSNN